MEPKKGVHFSTSKLGFLFVVFLLLLLHFCAWGVRQFLFAFPILAGLQFWQWVLGLLSGCLTTDQHCILGAYASRTRPWRWFWNPFPGTIKKHCLGPKPRPPYGLVGPNHLSPQIWARFFTNTTSYTQPEEKLRTQSQRWTPSPPGLRTLRWDRLSVFSYTKILLILFFKKRLFYPTWPGSILEKRVAETSKPASGKQFPLKNAQQQLPARSPLTPAVNVEIAALISDWILNFTFPRNIDCRGPGIQRAHLQIKGKLWRTPLKTTPCALLSDLFWKNTNENGIGFAGTEWLALARPYGGRPG